MTDEANRSHNTIPADGAVDDDKTTNRRHPSRNTPAASAGGPDLAIPSVGAGGPGGPARGLNRLERSWVLYDVANSAFVLLAASVIPIYVNGLLEGQGSSVVVAWGYAQTIASLVVALLMPILGALADFHGQKVRFFTGFFATGVLACYAMALPLGWFAFLAVYVVATIGINSSMTFYDAMLVDVTSDERMDRVSSHGYAWGYVGSTIPFIVCLALIMVGPGVLGISAADATRVSFLITATWWLAFTAPLLRSYKQVHGKDRLAGGMGAAVADTFKGLARTFRDISARKPLLFFMLAYFCYIDGVHTVISMSTSYGASLGIDSTQLVLALLVTQFVAFPSALAYGRLAGRFGAHRMIVIAIAAYIGIVLFAAFLLRSAAEFWVLAVGVGLFQGGIQALSRSYFGRLVPKARANEYYGLFDVFGRYATVMGTFLMSLLTQLTGSSSVGVLSIAVLLIAGLVFMMMSKPAPSVEEAR